MFDWPAAGEEIPAEIKSLAREAFKLDSTTRIRDILIIASQPDSEADVELIVRKCLQKAVQSRSLLVLEYLLTHGADVHTITPTDITVDWGDDIEDDELEEEEGPKYMRPSVELLDILLRHCWDINSIALPQQNLSPLLWNVCGSLELVQWCLDHGANVITPGEETSVNPKDDAAEIYHTPRHPLLLENVAAFGTVTVFELLRSRGAPLTPGKSWPPWHAPCLLTRAVQAAAYFAPTLHSKPSPAYMERVSVVKHLLKTIHIPADEGGPRKIASTTAVSNIMMVESGSNKDDSKERDLREIVELLLNANGSLVFLADLVVDSPQYWRPSTPLAHLQWKYPISFEKAVRVWQQYHPADFRSSKIKPGAAIETEPDGSSSATSTPAISQLGKLPKEIISQIAFILDRGDLLSFRSVSRGMCSGSFAALRAQIRHRRLPLTFESIEAFNKQLQQKGHLACYVKELAIHGEGDIDESSSDQPSEASSYWPKLRATLTEVFLTAKSRGTLDSLMVFEGKHMIPLVFSALQDSGLALARLALFPNEAGNASAIDQYRELPNIANLSSSLTTLQDLSWTITTSETLVEDAISSSNIATIKQILDMTSNLQTLELCWYRKPPRRAETFFIDSCLDALLAMTRLTKLTLRGIFVSESTLERLLSKTTATRVFLRHIKLREGGSLRPVLDALTSGCFDYFHLDDLFETRNGADLLARFDVPGRVKFPVLGGPVGPSEIVREGKEARRKLEYRFASGRPAGSSETHRYFLLTRRTYGYD